MGGGEGSQCDAGSIAAAPPPRRRPLRRQRKRADCIEERLDGRRVGRVDGGCVKCHHPPR